MAAQRRRTPTRSAALSGAPLPKGARIPRPALIISLARTIFIGALVLFFASPPILSWAHARERQGNGLLTLLAPIERPSAHAADAGSENTLRDDSDPIAPLLAAAAISILTPRVVAERRPVLPRRAAGDPARHAQRALRRQSAVDRLYPERHPRQAD